MGKRWCDHATRVSAFGQEDWKIEIGEADYLVPNDWDICPIAGCHAPRPKEQRKLSAEDLKAVEDFLVDELDGNLTANMLIKRLRERLG